MRRLAPVTGYVVLLCLTWVAFVHSQTTCSRSDLQGGSLLTVSVDETDTAPALSNKYRDKIPIYGNVGQSGYSVTLSQGTAVINPNIYFDVINNENLRFATGSSSGTYIRLIIALDRDAGDHPAIEYVTFGLTCTYNGTTSLYTLQVLLNDVNDNNPVFRNLPAQISLSEKAVLADEVYIMTASDRDTDHNGNGLVEYTIESGLQQNAPKFAINPATGSLTVNEVLNYEVENYYSLLIRAQDKGLVLKRFSTSRINITIIDENDQAAAFVASGCATDNFGFCIMPTYTGTVVSGTSTGRVSLLPNDICAMDKDTLGAAVTLKFNSTVPGGYVSAFQMGVVQHLGNGQYTAELNLVGAINRNNLVDTGGVVTVVIEAVETNILAKSSFAYVVVTVAVSNQFPPYLIINPYGVSGVIRENDPVGTLLTAATFDQANNTLVQIVIIDTDYLNLNPANYQLSTNQPSLFSVNSDGHIYLVGSGLDYETAAPNPFLLEVKVQELNTLQQFTATIQLTIQIEDANDNAPIFQAATYELLMPMGNYTNQPRQLGSVAATDADISVAYSMLTYNITAVSDNGLDLFSISSGMIIANGTFLAPQNYTITVQAIDNAPTGEQLAATTAVFVTVTEVVIILPSFSANQYVITVSEGALSNSTVFQGSAIDPDGDTLVYTMQEIDVFGQSQDFVVSTSGLVSVRTANTTSPTKVLDRELRSSYRYWFTVRDPQFQSATATLSIIISDINDNTPFFLSAVYVFSINENLASQVIGTVSATDNDEAGTLNTALFYWLPNTNRFSIHSQTGDVSTIGSLDYESQSQYILIVHVSDSPIARLTGTATLTVSVIDVQDMIPIFTEVSYKVDVPENVGIGSIITAVTANDRDSIPNVQYLLSGANSQDFNIQNIGGVGNLQVAAALDYETRSTYSLTVTTTDGQNANVPGSSVNIFVQVFDVNEFSPPVLTIPISVLETIVLGTVLTV